MKITVQVNDEFKTMFDTCGTYWAYGYQVYAQKVCGVTYVTFFTSDYSSKVHFNDSGSFDVSFYGKPSQLVGMIELAKSLGWAEKS